MHFLGRLLEARGWEGNRSIRTEIDGFVESGIDLPKQAEANEVSLKDLYGEKGYRELVEREITKARKRLGTGRYPELLRLDQLGGQFRVGPLGVSILGLVFLYQNNDLFDTLLRADGWTPHDSGAVSGFTRLAATLCKTTVAQVQRELGAKAPLRRLSLLDVEGFCLPAEFVEFLQGLSETPLHSLFYSRIEGDGRDFKDYGELAKPLTTCSQLFAAARRDGKGAAVVFHGAAGTGKSTAVHTIAREAGLVPWEIARLPVSSEREVGFRWRAMAAAVASLDPAEVLLVVDEADDLDESSLKGKGILTDLLDSSSHNWLFVGNDRPFGHEALQRRISFEISFPSPDEEFRRKLWREIAMEGGLVITEETRLELAKRFSFSPGSIHTVCRDAVRLASQREEPLEGTLMEVSSLHAKGMQAAIRSRRDGPGWREDCLNVKGGIAAPLARIRNFARRYAASDPALMVSQMNVLLSGPPGTGKTEFVKHLAKETGLKLRACTAADILGAYVGETEQNLKRVFQEVRESKAILFLDEIDSLLRDRAGAQRGWEVSQVNQLLTEMENFEGIFLAATNHRGTLDPAASRRFQVKLDFEPLSQAQRVLLWQEQLSPLASTPEAPEEALRRLDGLTPGDYRVVWSQLCLEEERLEPGTLVERLQDELRTRNGDGRRLGLVP